MPVTFTPLGEPAVSPDVLMPSRIVQPRKWVEPPRRLIPRKNPRDILFGPTPIERTLHLRQTLQKSASAPSIHGRAKTSEQVLRPTAGSIRSIPGLETISLVLPGYESSASLQTAILSASRSGASIHGGAAFGEPQSPSRSDAWLAILSGERHVGIPFNQLGEDSEACMHWLCIESADKAIHKDLEANSGKNDHTPRPLMPIPWARLRDDALLQVRRAPAGSGEALLNQSGAELFGCLQALNVAHGPRALAAALKLRLGVNAAKLMDCHGNGHIGLIDLAGSLSTLGLDIEILCCFSESTLLRGLGVSADGASMVSISKLLMPGDTAIADPNLGSHVQESQDKWAIISRWMGTAMLRREALRHDREGRGWHAKGQGGTDTGPLSQMEGKDDSFLTSTNAEASDPRCTVRTRSELLLETASSLRTQDHDLRRLFAAAASTRTPSTGVLMTRADTLRFFADLKRVDAQRASRSDDALIGRRFDEAMQMQEASTKLKGGLIFWSFKAVLNNVIEDLFIGWPKLITHLTET